MLPHVYQISCDSPPVVLLIPYIWNRGLRCCQSTEPTQLFYHYQLFISFLLCANIRPFTTCVTYPHGRLSWILSSWLGVWKTCEPGFHVTSIDAIPVAGSRMHPMISLSSCVCVCTCVCVCVCVSKQQTIQNPEHVHIRTSCKSRTVFGTSTLSHWAHTSALNRIRKTNL